MKQRSLRSRLVVGSVLWTIGLLLTTQYVSRIMIRLFPERNQVAHFSVMSVIALVFMAAALTQVRSGMSPLYRLRARLSSVRNGQCRRVDGDYPTEVQPLVNDLNALLDQREQAVQRAQAKAGDLAHGLKTPLAVLSREAERVEASGQHELAATIGQQVERMRRQIEYHLAHARAAASGPTSGARCSVKESAEGLARTLRRLHAERELAIDLRVAPEHSIRCQREDLDEMLGNLLDNGCKWATSKVRVESLETDNSVVILVDDDGPGLDPSMHDAVLQRGVRADEAAPGSGLGLAIVRDLAELYGGSIALTNSTSGGLRARLVLPA